MLVLVFIGYVVLQAAALVRSRGGMRLIAAVPLIVIVPLIVQSIYSFVQKSNLWPLLLVYASPAAFLYLLIVNFVIYMHKRSAPPVE